MSNSLMKIPPQESIFMRGCDSSNHEGLTLHVASSSKLADGTFVSINQLKVI